MKIGKVILWHLFQKYSIYNNIIEEYLMRVDEVFTEVNMKSEMWLKEENFNLFQQEISKNNSTIANYFKLRYQLKDKKLNFEAFKNHYEFKKIGEYFDIFTNKTGYANEKDMEAIYPLAVTENSTEVLLYSYLENYVDLNDIRVKDRNAALPPGFGQSLAAQHAHPQTQASAFNPQLAKTDPRAAIGSVPDLNFLMEQDSGISRDSEKLGNLRFQSRSGQAGADKKLKPRRGNAPDIIINATVAPADQDNALKLRYQDLSEKLREKEKQLQALKVPSYKHAPTDHSLSSDKDRDLLLLKQELDSLRRENMQLKGAAGGRAKTLDQDLLLQDTSSGKALRSNHEAFEYHSDPVNPVQASPGVISQFFQNHEFAAPGSTPLSRRKKSAGGPRRR